MQITLRENLYSILVNKILLLFILFSSVISAQNPVTIDDIKKQFDKAIVYVNTDNAEKAIPLLHKINKDCKSIDYKLGITRVGHILAVIYFNSSDYKKVITLDDEFLKTGIKIENYEKLSHIHRLKGCAYSELGFLNKGNEERLQALKYAKKMEAGNNKQYAMSLIYSNLADHYIKSAAPQDSVFVNVQKSIKEAKKISEVDNYYVSLKYSLIAYSYMIFGNEYSTLDPQVAESYFLKSLEIHNAKSIPLVERIILLSQLGVFYYSRNEYEKAVKYAELGLTIGRKASFPQTRRDLFETLFKSYMELRKTEESKRYLNLFTALNDSISNVEKKAVDTTLSSTISKQEKTYLDDTSRRTLIYSMFSLALIVSGILFFLYYKKKKQKQIKKIETILEQLKIKQGSIQDVLLVESKIEKTEEKEQENMLMSVDAGEKLLEKLHDFEQKKLFLERKVSLSYVAAEIGSNTKYLSYIIKKYKGKDFNKYINDLRINYIIQKINDDPLYRRYKINFLAEETGFSSHSKFATIFKSTIGVSPSEFIKYLEDK